jgi:hypothetical protein
MTRWPRKTMMRLAIASIAISVVFFFLLMVAAPTQHIGE